MDQAIKFEEANALQDFGHCVIKEELIIPESDDESFNASFFDSNVLATNIKSEKNVVPSLRAVRKPKSRRNYRVTVKKSEKVTNAPSNGFVVIVEPDIATATKNLTKSHCPSCQKRSKVIVRKARCAECSTALAYICENCEKTYKAYNSLLYHLKATHVPIASRLKCSKCARTFVHRSNALAHEKVCGRKPSFACADCPHRAYYKSNLRQHIREKHSGHVFGCETCGKVFSNQRSLDRHARCYCGKQRSLQCHHCQRKVFRKDHMIGHLQRIHPEVYSGEVAMRTCRYCGETLKNFEHTRRHLKGCESAILQHADRRDRVADQPDLEAAVKNLSRTKCARCKRTRAVVRGRTRCTKCQTQLTYTCDRCGLSYPTSSGLRQHLKQHVVPSS